MTSSRRLLHALSLCTYLGLATSASAQPPDPPEAPAAGRPPSSAWHLDLSGSLGDIKVDLKEGRYPTYAPGFRPSRNTWAMQGTVGVYWRERFKTEFEVGALGATSLQHGRETGGVRSDVFDDATIATSASTTHVILRHNYEVRRWAVAQLLQFRSPRRVRPYVGIAVGVDRETDFDDRIDTVGAALPEADRLAALQSGQALPTDPYPATFASITTTHVHVAARAGVKLYVVRRRVFCLFEGIAGTRTGPARVGIGIDLL